MQPRSDSNLKPARFFSTSGDGVCASGTQPNLRAIEKAQQDDK